MRKLIFEDVKDMEKLHCYDYYKEDEDYSERDYIKMELQNKIITISDTHEFEIDSMIFTIKNDKYIFYADDEFITLHIIKDETLLIATQNPNEIIEFIKILNNSDLKMVGKE